MKKLLFLIPILFCLESNAQIGPYDGNCCSETNFVKNGSFEKYTGPLGGDKIPNANNWKSAFTNLSGGDYWGTTTNPTSPVTQPITSSVNGKRWAGMWLRHNCTKLEYREGLKGELSQAIAKNSGKYCITMNLAIDKNVTNSVHTIEVYGYSGTINNITNTAGNCNTPNTTLFPTNGATNMKLLATFSTAALDDNLTNSYTYVFDSAILTGGINKLLITRKDGEQGMAYLFIDNVKVSKFKEPCKQ